MNNYLSELEANLINWRFSEVYIFFFSTTQKLLYSAEKIITYINRNNILQLSLPSGAISYWNSYRHGVKLKEGQLYAWFPPILGIVIQLNWLMRFMCYVESNEPESYDKNCHILQLGLYRKILFLLHFEHSFPHCVTYTIFSRSIFVFYQQ